MEKLINPTAIAEVLLCSTKTVLRKMRTGELPSTTIAGKSYMTEKQLERLVSGGEKRRFEKAV